jgi:5-methyltetrahydropteroyltriglutamate--homocysteine methyltransferase
MKRSTDRILTSHAGSLPRPDDLRDLFRDPDSTRLGPRLKAAVSEVVNHQVEAGVDIVNDGEYGKPMTEEVDYGAWAGYIYDRLSGFETRQADASEGFNRSILVRQSKDRIDFADFYASPEMQVVSGRGGSRIMTRVNTGPIAYTGHALVQREIDNLKAALGSKPANEAFLTAVVTGVQFRESEYYQNLEEQAAALAEALREEYRAITSAGFNLQLDDPIIVNVFEWHYSMGWDMTGFRKWAAQHVELVNHALQGIPQDQVRYHLCWGSWKGPHSTDLPLADVIDLVLKVNASQYSVEAANVQHEHEWKVWKDVKLPEGKSVMPGVVTHKTNVLEHPEVIADRIARYAEAVGKENVVAGTDCGMGGRIHPQLAWAKLQRLSEGAALASKQLWGK